MLKPDGIYFAYLRKSREDRDAEKNGAEDTLARHEYILREYAARYNIKISKWYKEVLSGETIADRPEMTRLLHDVEFLRPDGVLVVEVERLSRGNPQDQGRVMDTFKYSNTLIITPMKVFDLTKENDEEWIDFGLLRSRMEYRTIKRRLQSGRMTSAMQGKYIGNVTPYGWKREKLKNEKGYTLVPDPETGPILKLMYTLYDTGNEDTGNMPIGITRLAHYLDEKGIPAPKGDHWNTSVVGRILANPINIGMLRIGWRKAVTTIDNGVIKKSRPINADYITVPARWEPLIDTDQFNRVCAKLGNRNTRPVSFAIKSPLAGIVECSICHRNMQRRPKGSKTIADTLMCTTYRCPTVASYYELVEDRILNTLEQQLEHYKIDLSKKVRNDWNVAITAKENEIAEIKEELSGLNKQSAKIHTLFEQDIYDLDTFLNRNQEVTKSINQAKERIGRLEAEIFKLQEVMEGQESFAPRLEHVLESYRKSDDPVYKNTLLKEVIEKVEYTKTQRGQRDGLNNDAFTLDIHLKVSL